VISLSARIERFRVALSGAGAAPRARATELAERLGRGEPAAVAEAYDAHHAHVRRLARRLVGDDAAAEDLVQEVFVTLPRAMRRFEGGCALRTFLTGIAVNHARHHVRAAARRRAAAERMSAEPMLGGSGSADPETLVSGKQLACILERALDTLPLDQRVAFVLLEVEQMSASEAGRAVGAPEATMRTRLFHAKRKLRERLDQEGVR